jgi:hypothetical protein
MDIGIGVKPTTGFAVAAASAWLLLGSADTALTDSAGDQLACSKNDAAACTRIIEDATELNSHRLTAYAHRGIVHAGNGDHDSARADFREAVHIAGLPAALVPDGSKPCRVGQPVAVSGTIQDIKQGKQSWSAGTIAHADDCSGLTDPSTGFAALFGSGPLPSKCRGGKRFLATGAADYGREPEFFVKVHKISCD